MLGRVTLGLIPAVFIVAALAAYAPKATPRPTAEHKYVEALQGKDDFDVRFGDNPVTIRRVRTVQILAPPVSVLTPPVEEALKPEPPKKRARLAAVGDICSRHNMKKVYTRGGKSWRCRK